MKKIVVLGLFLFFSFNLAYATDWDSASALKRVNYIGNNLLKANNINHHIEFKVADKEDVNAYANLNKEIYVYKGLLNFVETDDELAGVIGHEMGHIVNGHCAKQGVLGAGISIISSLFTKNQTVNALGQKLAKSKLSRHDEFEADLTGVDIMTKANYNPLAMVSLLNKISGNYVDILMTHPSGEKRILNVYNYIEYNYPSKLKYRYNTESYKKALVMITPTVEKRKNSERLVANFTKKQQELQEKKIKRAKKMQSTSSVWEGYFTTLQYLAN